MSQQGILAGSSFNGVGTPLEELLALSVTCKFVGDPNAAGGVDLSGGGKVDAFNDLSGNGAHFDVSTATDSLKPTIGGSGQIIIDGADSYLESNKATTYWDFLTRPSESSLVVFARIKDLNVGSASVHDWWSAGNKLGTSNSWHQQKISSNRFRSLRYKSTGNTFFESATGLFTKTGFWNYGSYLDSTIHNASSGPSSLFLYEDNIQVANLSATKRTDVNLSTQNSLIIGRDRTASGSPVYSSNLEILKLYIAEGDIDSDDRTVIETWLND